MPTKANAETRKIITNFLNDIFILSALFYFGSAAGRAGIKIFILKPSNSRPSIHRLFVAEKLLQFSNSKSTLKYKVKIIFSELKIFNENY